MITKDKVIQQLGDGGTHRKQFSVNSGIQNNKASPTFSVPFDNGLRRHFHDGTKLSLSWGARYNQYYCFLRDQAAIETVQRWVSEQGTRVFLRNLMDSSLALDLNFEDNASGQKTKLGHWEERAKHHQDGDAFAALVHLSSEAVTTISYLRDCEFVLGIPAMADKEFDLPRELARAVAAHVGKKDLTPAFQLVGKSGSAKTVGLSEKWDIWASCSTSYNGPSIAGRRVCLIDDKYQSGITIQFWAAKLIEMGAAEVHGLSMVKTLRDTDNL